MARRVLRAERRPPEGRGKYVYCIVRAAGPRSFGRIGFDGEEVATIEYREIMPVVSDATFREYAAFEEDVEVHKKVVETVMKEYSVLPVAYGMVFKNRKLLDIAMGAGYAAMKKAFDIVDGKVELGIKVLVPKDVEGSSRTGCKSDFLSALKPLAADSRELTLFSDRLAFNSAFLVDRGKIDEFSKAVGELSSKYADLKVQYSGPWPAYNFVDIHILGKQRKGFR